MRKRPLIIDGLRPGMAEGLYRSYLATNPLRNADGSLKEKPMPTNGIGQTMRQTEPRAEATERTEPMQISPENFFSRCWHTNCPAWLGGNRHPSSAVMRRLKGELTIEDGSTLLLWECLSCGGKVYAGVDATRAIVTRPHTPPRTSAVTEQSVITTSRGAQ